MVEIKFEKGTGNHDAFNLYEHGQKIGEMEVSIYPDTIKVYHTIVNSNQQGKGYAKKLLSNLVDYARVNKQKIIPVCEYVHSQFNAHPELYQDVWLQE